MKKRNKSSITLSQITLLTILLFFGLVMSSSKVQAQDSDFEVKLDYEYYDMDLRAEHSYYPDKTKHIRGLDYVKISSDKDHIILNISDSLFANDSRPRLSVIVEDGVDSDMPIASVQLGTKQTHLNIHKLIGDKDYVRVVVWVDNLGDNDAKRVLEIRRNFGSTTIRVNEAADSSQNDLDYLANQKASILGLANIKVSLKENELLLSVNDTLFSNNGGSLFLSVIMATIEDSNMPITSEMINDPEIKIDLDNLMIGLDSAQLVVWLYDSEGNGIKRVIIVLRNTDGKTFNILEQD